MPSVNVRQMLEDALTLFEAYQALRNGGAYEYSVGDKKVELRQEDVKEEVRKGSTIDALVLRAPVLGRMSGTAQEKQGFLGHAFVMAFYMLLRRSEPDEVVDAELARTMQALEALKKKVAPKKTIGKKASPKRAAPSAGGSGAPVAIEACKS